MDADCLVLNDVVKEELLKFGSWYLDICEESTDVMNALFRYGYCLPQISLCVAKTILDDTCGDISPWTRESGFSPKIVTALMQTLGLPTDHPTRLQFHIVSSSRPFRVHAAYHDSSKSIVRFSKRLCESECNEATYISNQCNMAQANQHLLWILDSKHKQREQRVLRARSEFIHQQRKQLQEQRKQKHEEWLREHNFVFEQDEEENSNMFIVRKVLSLATLIFALGSLLRAYLYDDHKCPYNKRLDAPGKVFGQGRAA